MKKILLAGVFGCFCMPAYAAVKNDLISTDMAIEMIERMAVDDYNSFSKNKKNKGKSNVAKPKCWMISKDLPFCTAVKYNHKEKNYIVLTSLAAENADHIDGFCILNMKRDLLRCSNVITKNVSQFVKDHKGHWEYIKDPFTIFLAPKLCTDDFCHRNLIDIFSHEETVEMIETAMRNKVEWACEKNENVCISTLFGKSANVKEKIYTAGIVIRHNTGPNLLMFCMANKNFSKMICGDRKVGNGNEQEMTFIKRFPDGDDKPGVWKWEKEICEPKDNCFLEEVPLY